MNSPAELADAERRVAQRSRAFMSARIVYNGGAMNVECVIRNISDTGAKISVSAAVVLPDQFDVIIPQRNVVHRAHMVWRHADAVGVTFVGEAEKSENHATEAVTYKRRIHELEAEVARLRQRIRELTDT